MKKRFKYVVTFFFRKCQKFRSVGRRETEKKKGMALIAVNEHLFHLLIKSWFKYLLEAKAT